MLFVLDAGYDAPRIAYLLADLPVQILARMRYAALGFDLVNVGPLPGTPDPAGWVTRYGEEIAPRLTQIG
jgi:hypothetical protein